MYPWATKEYVLYKMSLGQAIMYVNLGTRYRNIEAGIPVEKEYDYDELAKRKKEMEQLGLLDSKKEALSEKYGDINDEQ